ncbi:MGF 110-4L [African swine fever virus]|nr:MGF 110-4L [African swine fever virus]
MLVVFLGILGLLANQVLGLPTQAGGHLRSTDNPPQEELGYCSASRSNVGSLLGNSWPAGQSGLRTTYSGRRASSFNG